jgi:hypothetical protein
MRDVVLAHQILTVVISVRRPNYAVDMLLRGLVGISG